MRRFDTTLVSAALAASLLSGCATTGQQTSSTQRVTTVVVCDDAPATGSNIGRLRCYRKTDLDERGESDRGAMHRTSQTGTRPPPGAK